MPNAASLTVVLPCYNEEEAADAVIKRLLQTKEILKSRELISSMQIIVVDDCSTDSTPEILKKFEDRITVLRAPHRFGYGGALKHGFQQATGDLVAFYDVDFTYDPFDLVRMIETLNSESLDVVCGDRLSLLTGMPLTRKMGNTLFVNTISFLYRCRITDACTGMRLFRRSLIPVFTKHLPDELSFTLAMTIYILFNKISFAEVPIFYYRRMGASKLKPLYDGPLFLFTILKYWALWTFQASKLKQSGFLLSSSSEETG